LSECHEFWHQGVLVGPRGAPDRIEAYAETDFAEDLKFAVRSLP